MLFRKKKELIFKWENQVYEKGEFIKKIYEESLNLDEKERKDFIDDVLRAYDIRKQMTKQGEKKWAFITAVLFLVALIILAVFIPEPSSFQYTVFRIISALSAAGFIVFVPGFFEVKIGTWARATGAVAAFLLVYFYLPV